MCFSKHFDIIDEEDEDIAEYDTPLNNNSEILLRVADVTKFDEEVKYLADSNVVSWRINHFITDGEQVAAVTSRIIKINQKIKDECESCSDSSGPGVDTLAEKQVVTGKYFRYFTNGIKAQLAIHLFSDVQAEVRDGGAGAARK